MTKNTGIAIGTIALLAIGGCASVTATNPIQTGAIAGNKAVATRPAAGGARVADRAAKGVSATHVVAGKLSRVYTLVSFDKNCRPVEPQITVDLQPTKGAVSFDPGKSTIVQYSSSGSCVGKTMPGTVIQYTARAGSEGTDSFSISAKSASGQIGTRAFKVEIVQ